MPTPTHQNLRIQKSLNELDRRVTLLEGGEVEATAEPETDWMEVLEVPEEMRSSIREAQENPGAYMRPALRAFAEQRHSEIRRQFPVRADEFDAAIAAALKALAS